MTAFAARHIGPTGAARQRLLADLGLGSLDALMAAALPAGIRAEPAPSRIPAPATEREALAELRALAARNAVRRPMIGLGYSSTVTPAVIQRNLLENPAWYTAYTPYQPEISQGRLEALLNFQTVVEDLTGLAVANASMLDEATAAVEAMLLARRASGSAPAVFLVDEDVLPQTWAVLQSRAAAIGIEAVLLPLAETAPERLPEAFGVLVQYPGASGRLWDPSDTVAAVRARGGLAVVAADLLGLAMLRPPGELGADIAVGSSQRLGVPLGFGGPHAGYLAVRPGLERQLPGRLVGVSVDAEGRPAYRLALQTREQHIRREKATSNICTAQALLASMAAMYAVYHGPEGLRAIARSVHAAAVAFAAAAEAAGLRVVHEAFFDTVQVAVADADTAVRAAHDAGILIRRVSDGVVGVSFGEPDAEDAARGGLVTELVAALGGRAPGADVVVDPEGTRRPASLARTSEYLTHPVFHAHRSETAMMRYLRRLADRDYALDRGMIPLGSCTMKLNAAAEMAAISWPEFAGLHPFAPAEDAAGYLELIGDLELWLAELTGYDTVSLQPNAGSQGELAGLLAIRRYHRANGEEGRDVVLIPQSAHGTNAASAVLAGLRVVPVATDADGNVDLVDLAARIAEHRADLAGLMITYPSTHGVYEAGIRGICDAVHEAGGQVYIDGANLNALLGHARFGDLGGDVSHLNLHKTFCIPHGGGGPGVGPVAAKAHLAPFLPGHPMAQSDEHPLAGGGTVRHGGTPVSAAPYGSPSILPIAWAYVRMMGVEGLAEATASAVLAANWIAARLRDDFPVLYAGAGGLVAHECILDLRPLREATGVTVDDVAKRLIDYGFHAPTMSFPVPGTLMVEPTESEDAAELERFAAAMAAIRREADAVAAGRWPADDNPLANAPHTARAVVADDWAHPYSRAEAVHPVPGLAEDKYWPPVRRVDNAFGDRNLLCACPPVEAFAEPAPAAASGEPTGAPQYA
ncbi:MAG: glycine dehydrogenase (aminomethyl-transferring) [Micrococcales bacterium 73-13]|nr:MAG: glycine dehydrogenase (aminomethyl-transferring) [Micrococcales bacterium 73-13]